MKFKVDIFQDEDGVYIAECRDLPGCVSQGATFEEAEENIKDAIQGCVEVRRELGMPPFVYHGEVEVPV